MIWNIFYLEKSIDHQIFKACSFILVELIVFLMKSVMVFSIPDTLFRLLTFQIDPWLWFSYFCLLLLILVSDSRLCSVAIIPPLGVSKEVSRCFKGNASIRITTFNYLGGFYGVLGQIEDVLLEDLFDLGSSAVEPDLSEWSLVKINVCTHQQKDQVKPCHS